MSDESLARPVSHGGGDIVPPPGELARPHRVLIVDDEEESLLLLTSILRRLAVEPITTTDPGQAVALFARHRPDIVLLDLRLGDVDGVDVMRAIKGLIAEDDLVPIVIFTADIDPSTRRRVLEAGAHDFLTKPLDLNEAVLRVRNLLQTRTLHVHLQGERSSLAAQVLEHDRLEQAASGNRRHMTQRIRSVLDRRAIDTVFQPIAELVSGRVVGVEALSRFGDPPERGPDLWFAEAHEVGLGRDLELLAVEVALDQLPQLAEDMFMSINISPEVLADCALHPLLAGRWNHRVMVELTEHVRVENYDALRDIVSSLRTLGTRLAVDDAGAGFASLQHILKLGPDMIKLDRSLTRDIDSDPVRRALTASLVAFVSEVGAQIVAEGIETRLERQALIELGVTMGQGFFLGRPGQLPVAPRLGAEGEAELS